MIVISVDPVLKLILSAESDSVNPSPVLTKTYLSSSKGKNVSDASPLLRAPVEPSVMVTSNCFLIVKEELVKSTSATSLLGNTVNKLLSVEDWNWEVSILKLEGLIILVGRPPSHTPVTVVTPDIVKAC